MQSMHFDLFNMGLIQIEKIGLMKQQGLCHTKCSKLFKVRAKQTI